MIVNTKKMKTAKKYLKYGNALVRNIWKIGVLIGITIVIMFFSVWNAVDLKDVLNSSTRSYVTDITRQMTDTISDTIKYKKADMVNVADSIGQVGLLMDDLGETADFMGRKAKILEFDELILFNSKGDYVISSNTDGELDFDIDELFKIPGIQMSFQGITGTSFLGDHDLFYSTPVWENGKISKILVGVRSKENMQSIITAKSFNGKCFSCIVDGDSQMVLVPTDLKPFSQLEDIFEEGSDEIKADILEMKKNISCGKAGIFKFISINGEVNFLSYNPLNVNDWVLLTIVPANLISAGSDRYILRLFLLIGGVFAVFLVFWLVLYRIDRKNRKQLMKTAFEDPITGGMNNNAFRKKYRETVMEQSLSGYTVVLLDIKSFRLINEKFGLEVGNQMLHYIYEVIKRHLKKEKNEFATRTTDNFFLCIREQDPNVIQNRLNEIIDDIHTFRGTDCPQYRMIFKQGACLIEDQSIDMLALQDRAHMAIQKHGAAAEQNCVFYDESIVEKIRKEQELDGLFEESLKNHDFEVYLQPKVRAESGKLAGAEALIRWKHPRKGMIFPDEFIPLFEGNGKICRLDLYVFEEVCKMLNRRKAKGKPLYPVSVNLSRYHYYHEDFLEDFQAIYQQYDLPANIIEFELTESIFMEGDQITTIKESIDQMHQMGFLCSLDDFGAGFSSLGLLKEFDVDTLKLDRVFFLDMSSKKARDIVESLINLAKTLHVKTVAEGIEIPEQLEYLNSIHCDEIQGYIFSKPLPIPEFEEWEVQNEQRHSNVKRLYIN